jgi:hypothetical protein
MTLGALEYIVTSFDLPDFTIAEMQPQPSCAPPPACAPLRTRSCWPDRWCPHGRERESATSAGAILDGQ